MRAPLRFVYGNVCLGSDQEHDAWALFVAQPHSFGRLAAEDKRERFGRLVGAVEAIEADLQILRLSRPVDVDRYGHEVLTDPSPHGASRGRLVAEHRDRLSALGSRTPWIALAVRLDAARSDVAAFARTPR